MDAHQLGMQSIENNIEGMNMLETTASNAAHAAGLNDSTNMMAGQSDALSTELGNFKMGYKGAMPAGLQNVIGSMGADIA